MRTPLSMTPVRRDFLPWIPLILLMLLAPQSTAFAADDTDGVITQRLQVRLGAKAMTEETVPVWVYFTDRGVAKSGLSAALDQAERNLHPRAAKRRAKVMEPGGSLVDERDLPVAAAYIDAVTGAGADHREVSRWFNAASFNATAEQIEAIARLPFVGKVDAVAQGIRRSDPPGDADPAESLTGLTDKSVTSIYDYGSSLTQAQLANVPAAHDAGWTGSGVLVGFLDSGFRTTHDAFTHLDVVATYDFVNDDTIVDNEPEDPVDAYKHGSMALSDFAAFSEGNLVSPAFNASVILAKTEDVGDEQPIEEDYWVAGLEWIESLGADLASSSLGYYYWYTYEDLDGDTAVTTRAADMAAGLGMLVITSAGNERSSEWGWVTAPADGDSVVAVGATYNNGYVAYFSSPGPTYDGRIKPDVMAMGRSVAMIKPDDDLAYTTWSGTSFACPITSGVAALLLERHPYLTPMQIRDALRETADKADSPDNDYGWGMINAVAALDYFVPKFSHTVLNDTEDQSGPYGIVCTLTATAGLVTGTETLMVRFNGGTWQAIPLANTTGDTWTADIPGQPHGTLVEYYLTADNTFGETGVLPVGAPAVVFSFNVNIDADSPVITHAAIPDWPSRHWPAFVTTEATDNAFLTSVTVDWTLNGVAQTPFPLVQGEGDTYSSFFPAGGPAPATGDTVTYSISAQDGAGVPNITVDGPHTVALTASLGRVLVVDDTQGGTGPADMALWLTNLGYDHQTITPDGLLTTNLESWQVMVLSTGSAENPAISSSNPVYREVIREWADMGGPIFLESGNVAPNIVFYDEEFAQDVFRLKANLPSNGGYFVRNAATADHPVVTTPNALGSSMILPYNVNGQDTVLPTPGAVSLYSPYSFPGAAGVLAYDDTSAPQGGHFVYLTGDITTFWASANVDLLFENAMEWLAAVEPAPSASISGQVNLLGATDGGVTVTAGRFYETTTAPDGTFTLPDMYEGIHTVRVFHPGFEVGLVDVTLAVDEHLTGLDFELSPTEEFVAYNDTVTAIPGSNALGVDMFIEFGPEHVGKTLADIQVTVDISHQNSGEVTLKLFSPTGTEVCLRHRTGGGDIDIVGTFATDLSVDGPGSLDDYLGEPIEGIWRLNVSDTVIQVNGEVNYWALHLFSALDVSAVEDGNPPHRTALLANVPNPFNPLTRIAFDMARDGHAKLAVYDLGGRRIRTLVDGHLPAGRHALVWDGKDSGGRQAASGVYLYRLETGSDTWQRKMLLIK